MVQVFATDSSASSAPLENGEEEQEQQVNQQTGYRREKRKKHIKNENYTLAMAFFAGASFAASIFLGLWTAVETFGENAWKF